MTSLTDINSLYGQQPGTIYAGGSPTFNEGNPTQTTPGSVIAPAATGKYSAAPDGSGLLGPDGKLLATDSWGNFLDPALAGYSMGNGGLVDFNGNVVDPASLKTDPWTGALNPNLPAGSENWPPDQIGGTRDSTDRWLGG